MSKENSFLKIITYTPLFFIPLFVSIIVFLSYQVYSLSFDSSVKELRNDLLQREKEAVKNKVQNLTKLIVYQKSRIKEELINRVKGRVETANMIAYNIHNEYKDTKSEEEIKDIINTTLQTFTWNDAEGYIWVMNEFGVHYLIENKKDLEGTSYIDFQDAEGRFIVREEIAICKEKGEGYLWDTFTKPQESNGKQYKQVAFVKAFEPYNWCLGSAEFLDTATKKTNKFLFDMVSHVDKIGSNYVYIINENGNILVHSKLPQLVGEDVNITNKLVLQTIAQGRKAIEGKNDISYIYDWHNFTTGQKEKKYAYLQRIPNTDWLISSGFFLSQVDEQIQKQKVSMLEIYKAKSNNIFYLAILVILISLIISFIASRKIRRSFSEYESKINSKEKALVELNSSLEEKVKKRTVELEHIKDDFEKLATTDALTHIDNRYSIMKILSHEISRAKRHDSVLSVLMYDIDHFKVVNDTYGHNVGDRVLVALSDLVSKNIREIDYLGRYGGEEFLIVMPNTSLEDASVYAERLREVVESSHFEGVGKMTISIGVVELQKDEDMDLMFKRVDDLLYLSKSEGRNKISS